MEESDSDNELLKDPFSAGKRKEFTPRKLNLNIFERRLNLSEKVHKLSDVFSNKSSKNLKQFQ